MRLGRTHFLELDKPVEQRSLLTCWRRGAQEYAPGQSQIELASASAWRTFIGRDTPKPTPNRLLQIGKSFEAPVAEYSTDSGAMAKLESVNQPWSADLSGNVHRYQHRGCSNDSKRHI
jgi:hypothetical protein